MADNRKRCWEGMLHRCDNPNAHAYNRYGGRGIKVCERWRKFENFCNDMGSRPQGFTIERRNNNKGYSPENCHWASRKEQSNNTRTNRRITYNGKTLTISQWAEQTGLSHCRINRRLEAGWSVSRALTEPAIHRRLITYKGLTLGLSQWSRRLNMSADLIRSRLNRGHSAEQAFTDKRYKRREA